MPVRVTRWGALCTALALGCIGDLDPKELVVSPRILDIVADPPELAPGGTVRLRAAGADPDVGPLLVEAQAPAELRGLRVGGVEAKSAEPIALAPGSVELEWDAATDLVYVDVLAPGTLTTRCAFADHGHATVPAPASQNGTFAVHRLRRQPLAGFERGELRFDAARLVPFAVRAK